MSGSGMEMVDMLERVAVQEDGAATNWTCELRLTCVYPQH